MISVTFCATSWGFVYFIFLVYFHFLVYLQNSRELKFIFVEQNSVFISCNIRGLKWVFSLIAASSLFASSCWQ